ncbi:hypothetical protein FQR65_LT17947 [Abscondita terminalis]|nr:hypothetical protein FQR65_LT17947 [Abscondita terminalis]
MCKTDENGAFILKNIDKDDVLLISCVGYKTQEISVGKEPILNIKLTIEERMMKDVVITAPDPQRLDEIYEKLMNDYRYRVNWRDGGSAGKTYKTFIKYEDINEQNVSFRNFQSLLRLSEMYYIAAECEPDPLQAITLLNTVRTNRGLPDLSPKANVTTELFKEYRKEFWGEGQTFFYFKRRALTGIPNGSANGFTIKMDTTKYVVPWPLLEIQNR